MSHRIHIDVHITMATVTRVLYRLPLQHVNRFSMDSVLQRWVRKRTIAGLNLAIRWV